MFCATILRVPRYNYREDGNEIFQIHANIRGDLGCREAEENGITYDRTKRSRFTQLGFLGLKDINLLKRTWEAGARPMGAPGWPEFALVVASTW